jgi:transposase
MQANEQQPPAPRKRKHTEYNDETRATVVRMKARGDSWSKIKQATTVPRSSAQSIVAVATTEGRTAKNQKGGNKKAVIAEPVKQLIIDLQAADNSLTLQSIANLLDCIFPAGSPSLNTIWRILQAAGFTTKRLSPSASSRTTIKTKEKRKEWVESVGRTLSADRAIFIDESPFSFTYIRSTGRSKKGERAVATVPQIRGRNHSVIAAISPSHGLLYFEIKTTEQDWEFVRKKSSKKKKTGPKGVTREVFRSFLINLLSLPLFSSSSSPFTLLFDNARIHKGNIDETIFQVGQEQQFLPAWSPELNPIEYVFSKWKLAFRAHQPDSEEAVDEAIQAAAKSITAEDCMNCFKHTQSLYEKAVNLEDL